MMKSVYPRLYFIASMLMGALILIACSRAGRREVFSEPLPTIENTTAPSTGDTVEQLVADGQERQYRLHIPPQYEPGMPVPLIINLHGYNSNAEQQENVSQMSVKADESGFIVVYPEGSGNPQSWKFGSGAESQADVNFIRDLIQHLSNQFNIDPQRIYTTGISNGAEMSYRLVCELGDVIAAFASVAGGYPPFRDCSPSRAIPVVAFHGTDDKLLPYNGQAPILLPIHKWANDWAMHNGCNPAPEVTFQKGDVTGETWSNCQDGAEVVLYTIEGKGHSWPGSHMPAAITTQDIQATDVIWEFFEAHPLDAHPMP
jgi:polyhydroxybutyrate depolymerase